MSEGMDVGDIHERPMHIPGNRNNRADSQGSDSTPRRISLILIPTKI